MTGYLFGAGKGDPRSSFDSFTNVGSVVINVSGGIIYGSVYGGSEDGHVLGNVTMNINEGAKIGTCGSSHDGNVFGGGRGFSGENMNAGAVRGNSGVTIAGGKILGNVYGGGELGSMGTFTITDGMRTFTWKDSDGNDNSAENTKNTGVCTVTINGGEIGTGVDMSNDGS